MAVTWQETKLGAGVRVRLQRLRIPSAVLLAGAFLLAVLLRSRQLGAFSLWFDEVFSARAVRLPVPQMLQLLLPDTHPLLYYFCLKAWTALFGGSETALRAMSTAFGSLAVGVLAAGAWRLYGLRAGLLSGSIAAVCPVLVARSQEARMYPLLVLLISTALIAALWWDRTGKSQAAWLYAGAVAASLHTHYFALFFWASVAATYSGYLLLNSQRDRLKQWICWNLIPLAAFLPWVPVLLIQKKQSIGGHWLLSYPSPQAIVPLTHIAGCFGMTIDARRASFAWGIQPDRLALQLLVSCALWTAAIYRAHGSEAREGFSVDDRGERVLLLGSSLVPLLLAWGISQWHNIWLPRGLQVVVPGIILTAALLLSQLRRGPVFLITVLLLLASGAYGSMHAEPNRAQWRQVVAFLHRETKPGEKVIVVPPWDWNCLDYYGFPADQIVPARPGSIDDPLKARIRENAAGGRIWLVLDGVRPRAIDRFLRLECGMTRGQTRIFRGLEVRAYRREEASPREDIGSASPLSRISPPAPDPNGNVAGQHL